VITAEATTSRDRRSTVRPGGKLDAMDVFDAVRTVLAVRRFRDDPVPDDVVHRIVEAGRLTASSMNAQPWHFVVVSEPETLRRLGRSIRSAPYIADAPLAVAVAYERDSVFGISDASRAIQSMILTAWEAGVGSNWAGFGHLDPVRVLLEIPDAYDVLAVVPFGYPADHRRGGRKNRKPVEAIASRERFGRPFA
jgi:nitroreductase